MADARIVRQRRNRHGVKIRKGPESPLPGGLPLHEGANEHQGSIDIPSRDERDVCSSLEARRRLTVAAVAVGGAAVAAAGAALVAGAAAVAIAAGCRALGQPF